MVSKENLKHYWILFNLQISESNKNVKDKVIQLQAWCGPEGG